MIHAKLNECKCSICKNDFLTESIDDEGRCKACSAANYQVGDATNFDAQDVVKSENQQRAEFKELVRSILKELLEEQKDKKIADKFKPKPCKECGVEFAPRSPNQQRCNDCTSS